MLVKGMGYFANQEAVREVATTGFDYRATKTFGHSANKDRNDEGRAHLNGDGGRNPRSVLTVSSEPYSGAHYACVDAETECLTIGGWKRYDQLREGMPIFTYNVKTQQLELQPMQDLIAYEYKGDLISVFGRNTNMVMTPDHRCVVMTRNKRGGLHPPKIVRADELKMNMKFPVAAILPDNELKEPNDSPEFFELLGWIMSDGMYSDSGGVTVYQSSNKPEHVKRLDKLAVFFGNEMRCHERIRDGYSMFLYKIHGELRKRVRLFVPDKLRIPEHFLTLPQEYLTAFLDGFVGGDGHIRPDGRITISQKNKIVLDMIQAMFLRMGRSCLLSQRGNGNWSAFVSNNTSRYFKNSKSSPIRDDYAYHGIVWCPTVDNGTWIARRGGRPFITGNCFPRALIASLIRATCPAKCCPVCGAGWAPVVEQLGETNRQKANQLGFSKKNPLQQGINCAGGHGDGSNRIVNVLGYRPSCECNADYLYGETRQGRGWFDAVDIAALRKVEKIEGCTIAPVPGIVLDPFLGSGTTLAVAKELGLRGIGLDLSHEYLDQQAKIRVGIGAPSNALDGLPMFADKVESEQ